MKNNNKFQIFNLKTNIAVLAFFAVFVFIPTNANAFSFGQIIDPLCLFACDNDKPKKVIKNYTYTDSNNINSNIHSPGATVNAVNTVVDSTIRNSDVNTSDATPANHYSEYSYNPSPIVTYNYNPAPSYNYNPPPSYNYPSLRVSCYPDSTSVRVNETVRWYTSVYGGNGNYHYSWSGTNGLSGNGSTISKSYNSSGTKNASVTVISGNQSTSANCDGNVYVNDHYYENNYNYNYDTNYNYPVTISCSANVTNIASGNHVRWTAYVNNNNRSYSITWAGTDGITGTGSSVNYRYDYPGVKYASISVYINGQYVYQNCSNTVQVTGNTYSNYSNYNSNVNTGSLEVACYADPINAKTNQPVSWRTEVVGGFAPYTYTWSGSDNLSGTESSVIKYYSTSGNKNGIITVKSADGKSATRACSNAVTIKANTVTKKVTPKPVVAQPQPEVVPQPNQSLSAATLFSLENVPWGWVAILIILILFATIVYLIYNRPKI